VTADPEERMLAGLGRVEVRAQLEPSPLILVVGVFDGYGELELPFYPDQARALAATLVELADEVDLDADGSAS
jgi:hypothetical protein